LHLFPVMTMARSAASILFLLLLLATSAARAQGTLTVWTDKDAYSEGEMITVTVRIDNTSGDYMHLPASTTCQTEFRLETNGETTLDLRGQPCTADAITVDFPPGSWREWTWMLDTVALGIPETDGEHQVIGFFPGTEMADTTTISAEAFIGGQASVKVLNGVSDAELAPVIDSLNVEVLESRERSDGRTETWLIRGTSLSEAVATYAADPRFGFFERDFIPLNFVSVDTENASTLPRSGGEGVAELRIYPNPCHARCTLLLDGAGPGKLDVDIYDALGRRVHTLTLEGAASLPDLAPGLYFLALRDGGHPTDGHRRHGRPVVGRVLVGR